MIRCIIIEDEPYAIEILEYYISQIRQLHLMKTFSNAIDALSYIENEAVDLIFTDIEMPLLSGLDLLKTLKLKPKVVIVTAYRDYAAESFELEVIDYLVKPVSFPRFIKAVNKAHSMSEGFFQQPELISMPLKIENPVADNNIWIKVDKKIVRISVEDIVYIESLKDYIRICAGKNNLVTHQSLNGILERLSADKFVRIHKSFIVALHKIDLIEGNIVIIKDRTIPIGRQYRQELFSHINL
ncbi:response regulator transcription factor [Dyadobacter flavalbus]|uniref:Response regulator transcription factor n=1 Tax=Dyadobacter flavalbus TaxID=2579942 RepID=A0A5M8QN59_9BACT|nr:LytTR family DNA-binding domain-containing protein [Dyadobacter flavalbus]KAA6436698.1 response regulator transcription factor [Dyadobacter flavalbus]